MTGIYFLDVDLKSDINGIKLGSKIREKDTRGFIIFTTTHLEMSYFAFKYKVEAPCFYGGISGYTNLLMMANLHGVPEERVDEVLEMVGMTSAKDKNVSKYSLGMKQRLGIARAFLNNPNIVILDEPNKKRKA